MLPAASNRSPRTPPRFRTSLFDAYTHPPSGQANTAPPSGASCQTSLARAVGRIPLRATIRDRNPSGRRTPFSSGGNRGPTSGSRLIASSKLELLCCASSDSSPPDANQANPATPLRRKVRRSRTFVIGISLLFVAHVNCGRAKAVSVRSNDLEVDAQFHAVSCDLLCRITIAVISVCFQKNWQISCW